MIMLALYSMIKNCRYFDILFSYFLNCKYLFKLTRPQSFGVFNQITHNRGDLKNRGSLIQRIRVNLPYHLWAGLVILWTCTVKHFNNYLFLFFYYIGYDKKFVLILILIYHYFKRKCVKSVIHLTISQYSEFLISCKTYSCFNQK